MNTGDTTLNRRIQYHAGYALVEVLVDLMAAGWQTLSRWMANAAAARQRRRARLELHNLSDRSLRDIGLERDQIDRLFL